MNDFLIHSMSEFGEIILTTLRLAEANHVVEIGTEHGDMAALIAGHVSELGGRLTTIDPEPHPRYLEWAAGQPHVHHLARPSLEAFDELGQVDAWLIDGDHNWYTVFNELKLIEEANRRDGKPMLAFVHDIAWPSGRRDMYYAPLQIPADYRHAYDFESGVFPDKSALVWGRGFRGMGAFAWAKHEGGARNGVRTAVDDFLADARAAGRDYAFCQIPAVFGLGVLFSVDAPWSTGIATLLAPYHRNRLLAALERNRLANYLQVLEWESARN
jgi:hypothetical protein